MVIVDTTVWIDFFAGKDTVKVRRLEGLLRDGEEVCICGVILTEVLQGLRTDNDYSRVLSHFGGFMFLEMNRRTFVAAADLYRSLRRRGVTIRKPVDCMIAAVAIENNIPLLHNDRDFTQIARYFPELSVLSGA